MDILIINGPNLNLLGVREPHIYGNTSFDDFLTILKNKYKDIAFHYFQSNSEGEIIDRLHADGFRMNGIILNAGAYTHTSLAIADAVAAIISPVIEVHISNIYRRETFRHHSFITPVVAGVIAGFGMDSYRLAVEALLCIIKL
ncbi:MAG: type II 3-dehydroquinate dehydratase [Cytophagaceae bacterium]|nr:type II 3-dehydroquinate dehydratase [Cytophagaceae bacterium]